MAGFIQRRTTPKPLAFGPSGLTYPTTWSATGTGTATWVGALIGTGVLATAGVGAASWVGRSTRAGVWASAGTSTTTWVGRSTSASVWSSAGTGTATWVGVRIITLSSVLASSGTGLASWVGQAISGGGGETLGPGDLTTQWAIWLRGVVAPTDEQIRDRLNTNYGYGAGRDIMAALSRFLRDRF